MTILEVIVAGVLVAGMMGICLKMLSVAAAQHHARQCRQTALGEVDNVMERLSVLGFDELTPERVGEVRLSEAAKARLEAAELSIEIAAAPEEPTEQPPSKRIAVSLRWQDRGGRMVKPVRLVAWKYRER